MLFCRIVQLIKNAVSNSIKDGTILVVPHVTESNNSTYKTFIFNSVWNFQVSQKTKCSSHFIDF